MDVLPRRPGSVSVIFGEDITRRTREVRRVLKQLIGSGFADGENVLVACHPKERESQNFDLSSLVESYGILVTDDVRELSGKINLWKTSHVILLGASHYQSRSQYGTDPAGQPVMKSDIALLAQALEMSGRTFLASGPSLAEDKPYGSMPELIALAQNIHRVPDASSLSRFLGHYDNGGRTRGGIYVGTGPMFAAKTDGVSAVLSDREITEYLIFKWDQDIRYGGSEQQATIHGGGTLDAVPVRDAYGILDYMQKASTKVPRSIFVTEAQMLAGLDKVAVLLANDGFALYLDGLIRSFNLMPFGDLPKAICHATDINFFPAVCSVCGWAATESQRYKLGGKGGKEVIPVPFNDAQKIIGGGKKEGDAAGEEHHEDKRFYRSTCLPDLVVTDMPKNSFRLPKYILK